MQRPVTVFLLDNVDSFTYNLVDELYGMGLSIQVYRNSIAAGELFARMRNQALHGPILLMLSPGPGAPHEAGCMPELLKLVQGVFPVIGICLGHQAIVEHYGGVIGRAEKVMHGKSSDITHDGSAMFAGLPNPLPVARYHSLVATRVPDCLSVCAHIETLPMAVYHTTDNMLGFQFHPESILTRSGTQLLKNSIDFLTQKDTEHV